MHVLLVIHGYPPAAMGGSELYVAQLAQALVGQFPQLQVSVLARESDPSRAEHTVREEHREGVRLFLLNNTFRRAQRFEHSYRHPAIRAAVEELLEWLGPDLVHVHHLTCLSTDLLSLFHQRGLPTVVTLHDYWLLCQRGQLLDRDYRRCAGPTALSCARCLGLLAATPPLAHRAAAAVRAVERGAPGRWGQRVRRLAEQAAELWRDDQAGQAQAEARTRHLQEMLRTVTLFLAPSQALRQRYIEFGVPAEKIALHDYGVEPPAVAPLREVATGGPLRIGFLGTLMVSKGPEVLLRAFASLAPGRARLTLWGRYSPYHGDDSYREVLRPLLQQPGVEHHGPLEHREVFAALREVDVLVVPSIWEENSPFVIREAFLAGAAVVGSRVGGIPELVRHEVNGLLVSPGEVGELRQALERLMEDRSLLRRLQASATPVRTLADDAQATVRRYRQLAGAPSPRSLWAVVVHHDTPELTGRCVHGLLRSTRPPDRIVVVDNGSSPALEPAQFEPQVEVLRSPTNGGYAAGANLGIGHALARGADAVLIANSDVSWAPEALEMLEGALGQAPGIVGPAVLRSDDPTLLESCGIEVHPRLGRVRLRDFEAPYRAGPPRQVAAVSGCAMLVSKEVFEQAGLFSETYFFGFEDVELCVRASRAGAKVRVAPAARVWHVGSATIGAHSPQKLYFATRNQLLFVERMFANRLSALPLTVSVLAQNLVPALRGHHLPHARGLRAVALGGRDFFRRRFGRGPTEWS